MSDTVDQLMHGHVPDGTHLFVALQSATLQDSAQGNAAGRINTRVLVYDVTASPLRISAIAAGFHHSDAAPVSATSPEKARPAARADCS